MRLGLDECNEARSTPKLSLSRLPCKPKQPPQMLTPPLHPSASVPFQWEEAPGKPRSPLPAAAGSKAARCLELPPGLLHDDDAEVTIMPSPMMVVGGPYAARSLSLACTFSFRRGPDLGSGRERGLRAEKMGGCVKLGSRRWRSWGSMRVGEEEKVSRGSFDLSQSLGEFFKSENKVKMRGIGRVRSFFDLSTINSNL